MIFVDLNMPEMNGIEMMEELEYTYFEKGLFSEYKRFNTNFVLCTA